MDRRRAAGALLALAACFACSTAAPTSNHTALDLYESGASSGCYYNFQHYGEGDRIMTNEPCLNCTCHNRMLMCYLRVCPFTKPIGQDCTVEKRADQCCPIVTCPDVPVDLLTSTSTSTSPAEYGSTGMGPLDKYGCSINGKFLPEGSKVPPAANKPCEHCYCIRNMTTCVMQECTLHVDGCTPIYHKDVCCPIRYSCDHAEDEIPLLDDMTTTVRPTPGFLLTTTTVPSVTQISQDCVHDEEIYPDGALIKTEKACEHCYCMKGDIVCVVQECGTPMENEGKNCTSMPPREGQCCPDTYICDGDNELLSDELTTTLTPPRRSGVEGSGYRIEDDLYTPTPTFDHGLEGSGEEDKTEKAPDATEPSHTTDTKIIPEDDKMLETLTTTALPEPDKGENTVPSDNFEETSTPNPEYDLDTQQVSQEASPSHVINADTTTIPYEYYTTLATNTKELPKTTSQIITIDESEISSFQMPTSATSTDDEDFKTEAITEESIVTTPAAISDIATEYPATTKLPVYPQEAEVEPTGSTFDTHTIQIQHEETSTITRLVGLETTTVNPGENEIHEELLPGPPPGSIPGEGDCLVDGTTYNNDTAVPSSNKCQSNCRCMSSIVKCEPIICSIPPDNMVNCEAVYDELETCCPTFICDDVRETIPPESHSQMSGTDSPIDSNKIHCEGDQCNLDQSNLPPQKDCTSEDCKSDIDKVTACGVNGCGDQHVGTESSIRDDIKQPEVCLNGKCISTPDVCIGEKCKLPTLPQKTCSQESGCDDTPQQPTCEGANCVSDAAATLCIGDECKPSTVADVACPNGDCSKPTESDLVEPECDGETCTKKEIAGLDSKYGTECTGVDCATKDQAYTSQSPDLDMTTSKAHLPQDFSTEQSVTGISEMEQAEEQQKVTDTLDDHELPITMSSVTELQEKTTLGLEEVPTTELSAFTKTETDKPITPSEVLVDETQGLATKAQTLKDTITTIPSSPATESYDIATKVPKAPITESYDFDTKTTESDLSIPQTTKMPFDSSELSTAESEELMTEPNDQETKAPQESHFTTEPISEPQDYTNTPEIPAKVHELTTESPQIPEELPEASPTETLFTEVPEIPVGLPEVPSTEQSVQATETPDTLGEITEAPKSPIELPEVPVTESQYQDTSEGTPEYQDLATKIPENNILTESPESPLTITEATNVESTEEPEKETEIPVDRLKLPVTESHNIPTEEPSTQLVTDGPESDEKISEVPVKESQDVTREEPERVTQIATTNNPEIEELPTVPEMKPQDLVTQVPASSIDPSLEQSTEFHGFVTNAPAKPAELPETVATEPQHITTELPESPLVFGDTTQTEIQDNATEAPKISVGSTATEPQDLQTIEPEQPQKLPVEQVTESENVPTMLLESSSELPQVPVITSNDMITKASERPTELSESEATEQQVLATDAPKLPEEAINEPLDVTTKAPKIQIEHSDAPAVRPQDSAPEVEKMQDELPEAPATKPQDMVTMAPETPVETLESVGSPEAPATKVEDMTTMVPDIFEIPVTEPQDMVTKPPESLLPGAQDLATEAPESPEFPAEVPVTEKQQMSPDITESSVPESPVELPEVHPTLSEHTEMPIEFSETPGRRTTEPTRIPVKLPEFSVTERHDFATQAPESPEGSPDVQASVPEDSVTESPATTADFNEVQSTESQHLVTKAPQKSDSSATEPQNLATEAPKLPSELPGITTTESDTMTDAPEIPELPEMLVTESKPLASESPRLPEMPVTESKPLATEDTESPRLPEMPVTESKPLATEDTESPRLPEMPVTESKPLGTEDTESPRLPEMPVTESKPLATEDTESPRLPEMAVTESKPLAAEETESPTLTEIPVTESEVSATELTESPVLHTTYVQAETQGPMLQNLPTKSPGDPDEPATNLHVSATEPALEITIGPEGSTDVPLTDTQDLAIKAPSQVSENPTEKTATETQDLTTKTSVEIPEAPATESQVLSTKITDDISHLTVTESQDFTTESFVPQTPTTEAQTLVTNAPEISISPELPEAQVTESEYLPTEAPQNPVELTEAPETRYSVTETPKLSSELPAKTSEPNDLTTVSPVLTEVSTTETENLASLKPQSPAELPEMPATEPQSLPTTAPESSEGVPEVPTTEFEHIPTEAHPMSTEITEAPALETQDNKFKVPESPIELPEFPTTEIEHILSTDSPQSPAELPEHSTEFQELATEAPETTSTEGTKPQTAVTDFATDKPVSHTLEEQSTESHLLPEVQKISTMLPDIQEPELQTPTPAFIESVTEFVPTSTQISDKLRPEDGDTPVTESQEPMIDEQTNISDDMATTVSSEFITEKHETPTEVTQAQEIVTPIPKSPEDQPVYVTPSSFEENLDKSSETTPYLVELQEHTHKIEEQISTTEESGQEPVRGVTLEVTSTTELPHGMLDSKYGEPGQEETTLAPADLPSLPFDRTTHRAELSASDESVTLSPTSSQPSEEKEMTTPATSPESKPSEEVTTKVPETQPSITDTSDELPAPGEETPGASGYDQEPDYVEEDQAFGPGTCRYGGKVYVSAQQIPRDDPCDFCFCFRSDIICLQQSCPPPIHGCHEEPIQGFCCPRYECPVSMATTLNVTTTTTTTTTTLPPHFLPHAYKGAAQRKGCQIKGHTYKVGDVVRASSGPCLHCTCGGDGQMKCDPKQCTPEPMLRQMIAAAAVSAKRRR